MSTHKKGKTGKIIAISLLVLFTIAGGTLIWLSTHYKSIIRQNLPVWVADASDSLYKVSVTDISINLLTSKVSITGIHLWPDSNRLQYLHTAGRAPEKIVTMNIPMVIAKGVSVRALLDAGELSCSQFYINKPAITITALAPDSNMVEEQKKEKLIKKISSDYIEIRQPNITYQNHVTADSVTHYITGKKLTFSHWLLAPGNTEDGPPYGKLEKMEADSLAYLTSTGLYTLQCGHISISDTQTTIKKFAFKPRYNRNEFYKKTGHQKEIYTIGFPEITLQGFEPEALINRQTIEASTISLKNPSIALYYSRIPPDPHASKMGKFPNQLLQKLGIKTHVQFVKVNNGKFSYTEKNAKTMREGSFHIDGINGIVSNISNMPQYLQANNDCTIKLEGQFMNQSPMNATFHLNLTDTNGSFSVAGEHRNLDAAQVNKMVNNLALADLKEFHASSIKFDVQGNQYAARGHLTMLYDKLNVSLLKIDDDMDMKKMGIVSFFTNAALVYDANPMPGKPVRSITLNHKRVPDKSFFNLIWKTMFDGVTETALRTKGAAEMVQDAGGDKKKKGVFKKIQQIFKKNPK